MSDSVVLRMRLQNLKELLKQVDRVGGLTRVRRQLGVDRQLPKSDVRAEIEKRIAEVREEIGRCD